MRKWAYLQKPYQCNKKDFVYKIMIYETQKEGVYVFLYCSRDAVQCSFDCWYNDLSEALEWEDEIDETGWHIIDDPMPYCQHDAFLPIRIKGRNLGNPVWGQYEIFDDGEWREYHAI